MLGVAQRPERSRQLVLLMAALLLPSVGVIGTMYATNVFEAGQCPPGALLWGTTGSGHLAQIIPLTVLPVWLIAWIATGRMARRGQSLLGIDARLARSALNGLVALLGGAWLFLLVNGAYSQFCVTTQTVSYRDGMFAPTEIYPWSDVTRVVATCRHVSARYSHDDVGYWLLMRNGRDIDLGYSQVPLQRLLAVADAGLHNVPHSYDASRVSRDCDPIRTRLLLAAGAGG
jgi:hypothetical protein